MSDDDPRKGSKHVALPPTANKTNVDTVVYILSQNYCYVDCPIIYVSYDTQQDAYHKGNTKALRPVPIIWKVFHLMYI
jgi:hypothetical protein